MNRFDKPVQYDYSFDRYMPEFYNPNMQLWAGVLDQKKKEEEAMDELLAKSPQYIKTGEGKYLDRITGEEVTYKYGDSPMMDYYQNIVSDIQKGLEEAALAGDKVLYNRLLKEGQRRIGTEWKPGGVAATLQARYDKLEAEKKRLAEQASKDIEWQSTNYPYAMHQLYQTTVGTYETPDQARPVGDANLYPFLNVQEKAIDFAKKLGETEFNMSKVRVGENGELKVQEGYKMVDPQNRELINNYLNSDNFRTQLGIQAFNIAQSYGNSANIAEATKVANEKIAELNAIDQEVIDYRNKLQAYRNGKGPAPTQEETQSVQAILSAKGMFSASGVDIQKGAETNIDNALDNFYDTYKQRTLFEKPGQFLDYAIKHNMKNIAEGVLNKKYTWDEEHDQYWMALQRYGWDQGLLKLEKELNYVAPLQPLIGYSGQGIVDPEDVLKNQMDAQNQYTQIAEGHKTVYEDRWGKDNLEKYGMDQLDQLAQEAFLQSKDKDGNADFTKFRQYLLDKGINIDNIHNSQGIAIGGGTVWSDILNGQYATDKQTREKAKTMRDNQQAIALGVLEAGFERYRRDHSGIPPTANQWLMRESGLKVNLDNEKEVFDYLFKTDYNQLSENEKQARNQIQKELKERGYLNEIPSQNMPNKSWTPAKGSDTERVEAQINDWIQNDENLVESQFYNTHIKGKTIKSKKVLNVESAPNGTPLVTIEIDYGTGVPQKIRVPMDDVSPNMKDNWRRAANQDIFNRMGQQAVDDEAFNFAGETNHNYYSQGNVKNEISVKQIMDKAVPGGEKLIVDNFTYSDAGASFQGEREFQIRGYKGTNGQVTFTAYKKVKNKNGQIVFEEFPGLKNFNNYTVLRSTLANIVAAGDTDNVELVKRAAKKVDDQRVNKPYYFNENF